ncbi:MAG: hypothetical protein ACTFAL_01895 [Candidatus Electronema sp. V4]|uniref:hypothetical protein n=1 Tax=Candidatus Electronema sp. V4 TaxID=3454756 RepID=UPI004055609D
MKETERSEFNTEQREENTGQREKEIRLSVSFSGVSVKEKRQPVFYSELSEEKTEVSFLKEDWREENIRRLLC